MGLVESVGGVDEADHADLHQVVFNGFGRDNVQSVANNLKWGLDNRITLAAGEAIYLPAGNLHAYLHGVGFEVMANSDNVLRGGLTPKHVDVPELLRVLDFTPTDDAPILPRVTRDGMELVYDTPAPEFAVSVLQVTGDAVGHEIDAPAEHDGPQILLAIEGSAQVHTKADVVTLHRGDSAWVAADDGPVRLRASEPARLFRVTVGI